MKLLKTSRSNAKTKQLEFLTGKRIDMVGFLSGVTCPGANLCRAHVRQNRQTGKRTVVDGPEAIFRCHEASAEARFANTFEQRQFNTRLLRQCKTVDGVARLLVDSWPRNADAMRMNVAGDISSHTHAAGLFEAMSRMPDRYAYLYSKSAHMIVPLAEKGLKPGNLAITHSIGSRYDDIALAAGMRCSFVVDDPAAGGRPCDHTDELAYAPNVGRNGLGGQSFNLLVHGGQRPGSWGSDALYTLKTKGIDSSYTRGKGANFSAIAG